MLWINRIIAVALIATCWLLWPQSARFPGSGAAFPDFVLLLIAILAALMFVRSLIPSLTRPTGGEGRESLDALIRPFATIAATAMAIYAISLVGFYPAIGALGIALMIILGVRKPLSYLATYAGLMLFLFLLFQQLLGVPLTSTNLWGA